MSNILSGSSGRLYCYRQNSWSSVANLKSRMHEKRDILGNAPSWALAAFRLTAVQTMLLLSDFIRATSTATDMEDVIDKPVLGNIFLFILEVILVTWVLSELLHNSHSELYFTPLCFCSHCTGELLCINNWRYHVKCEEGWEYITPLFAPAPF